MIGTYAHDEGSWMVLLTGEHDVSKWVPVPKSEVSIDGCTHPRVTPATLTAPPAPPASGATRKEQQP